MAYSSLVFCLVVWFLGLLSSLGAKVEDGTFLEESINSKLAVKNVDADTTVTCNVDVPDGRFKRQAELQTFGLHSHDDVELKGGDVTLSCGVDGYHDDITKTDIKWVGPTGDMPSDTITWTETTEADVKKGTTTLALTDVQDDGSYTCKVDIDGTAHEKTVSVDVFEITPVDDVVTSEQQTLARVLITGLQADYTDKVSITWTDTGTSTQVTDADKLHKYNYANDGIKVTVDADTTYLCKVSVTVSTNNDIPVLRDFPHNVVIDHVVVTFDNVIKESGTEAELQCIVSNVDRGVSDESDYSWTLSGSSDWNKSKTTVQTKSQTFSNTKSQVDYTTDEGSWSCTMKYELTSGVDRTLTKPLYLDIPAFTTPPTDVYVVDGADATFSCTARSTASAQNLVPAYSWTVDGAAQSGEIADTLTITGTSTKDATDVICIATYDSSFTIQSPPANLYSQQIVVQPDSQVYGVAGEALDITCIYTSQHASQVTASWNKDGSAISDDDNYDITNTPAPDTYTTKLTILSAFVTTNLKDAVFKCEFVSSESGTNDKTATIADVFEITAPPQQDTKLISGSTAIFDITVSTTDIFTLKYEWFKGSDVTKVNPNTAVSTYTTPQLFYADRDNKYSCKVTWTWDDGNQVLTTSSDEAGLTITDSCHVTGTLNDETSRAPTDDYVVDEVAITTSCDRGYILPTGDSLKYSQTCAVDAAIAIVNCEGGCYVATPDDSETYHGDITITDQESLDGASDADGGVYKTFHVDTDVTIRCSEGYVVTSSETSNTKTCKTEASALNMNECKLGCRVTEFTNAVYTDADSNDLIAPQDTMIYSCKENMLTSKGKDEDVSAVCADGANVPLNLCFPVKFGTGPEEDVGISYIELTMTAPQLDGSPDTLVNPTKYTCKVTGNEAKVTDDNSCIVNGLQSDSSYKYQVTSHYQSGATWEAAEKEFKTKAPYSGVNDDGTVSLDIPKVDYDIKWYHVIAFWAYKGVLESDFIIKLSRKKRAFEITFVYENFDALKKSKKSSGAFYVKKDIAYTADANTLSLEGLGLPAGESFSLAAIVCKSDGEDCVIGSGTSYNTPPDHTVAIAVGVVVGLLVVLLIGSGLFVYKRYPQFFTKRHKREDDHIVMANPNTTPELEEGNEMPDIERRIPDPIHVADFLSKYRRLMQDTEYLLDREYDEIKCEVPPSSFHYTYAKQPENKIKNRFVDILPYDETRVRLHTAPDHQSDYVNACYVKNMSQQCEFIAAQGPKEETINDYWQMIWENRSLSIVMVTNLVEKGRKKCAQYWSDEGTMQYGYVRVTVDGILSFPDYCIRTLTVERGSEKRCVYHFHYLIWPDHGAPPTTSLIDFCRRCFSEMVDGPVVVHCSAGVGRTGTLMSLHLQMRMLADDQRVDLFGIVCQLRRCRKLMVQTSVQYKFLYQAVREMIICDDTFVAVRDFNQELARLTTPRSGNQYMTLLDDQFKRLEEYCTIHITHDKNEFKTTAGSSGVNHNKNRFSNVLPYDVNRVKLRVTTGETGSDYINASYINSYHERDAFIATQGPKQNTIGDFWRMIFEKEVSIIVMLTPLIDRGRERCTMYWPRGKEDPICVDTITVHLLNVANPTNEYTVRTFSISIRNREEETTRQVKQYHYSTWTNTESPSSGKHLIKMIDQVKNYRRTGPIVVHCSAGIGRTAVFMAVYNCIDQLKQDEMIDLFTIVLRLRLQRNGMVQSVDQYAFCYRVMAEVCSMFDDYVNTQGFQS